MNRPLLAAIVVTALALLATAQMVVPSQAQSDERCFNETDYCISGRIREFWQENGGLSVFGFPTTPLRNERVEDQVYQVQWFERERLELHPDNEPPYDVLLGRLGVTLLEEQGVDWREFPRSEPLAGCLYFEQTGQNVCEPFLQYWQQNGLEFDGQEGSSYEESLALFGLPLSGTRVETLSDGNDYVVQWFERARFELHPENEPPYRVLFGLLGNEARPDGPPPPIATLPSTPGTATPTVTNTSTPTNTPTAGTTTPTATNTSTSTPTNTPTASVAPVTQPTVIEGTPPASSLSIEKIASTSEVQPGDQFSYNFAVFLAGEGRRTVTLQDTLDARLEVVRVFPSDDCDAVGQRITCLLSTSDQVPGRATLYVRVRPDAETGTTIVNQARVSGDGESTHSAAVEVMVRP
jgi:hypothetical protein